jgi:hypothetical protein
MDGSPLTASTDSEPTVVLGSTSSGVQTVVAGSGTTDASRQPAPATNVATRRKGGRLALWIGLAVLVIFLGAGTLLGLLFYYTSRKDTVRVNLPAASPTAKHSTTPKASPSPSSTERPDEEDEAPFVKDENEMQNGSDEVTPITWTTAASGFKSDVGRTYTFQCPPNGTSAIIWGNDIYTADSSICTAAVHAGRITLEDGGEVTIEYRPGRQIYGSTERNGITSNTFGEYPKSFVFKDNP